jgi:hypothetical protein
MLKLRNIIALAAASLVVAAASTADAAGRRGGAWAAHDRVNHDAQPEVGRLKNPYESLSQGRQSYPNPDRVPRGPDAY